MVTETKTTGELLKGQTLNQAFISETYLARLPDWQDALGRYLKELEK